jgi:hypothetical protein
VKEDLGIGGTFDLRTSANALVVALQERVDTKREKRQLPEEPVGKRRMCFVCNAQVPKSLGVINARFYCKRHRCSVCDCALNKEAITVGDGGCLLFEFECDVLFGSFFCLQILLSIACVRQNIEYLFQLQLVLLMLTALLLALSRCRKTTTTTTAIVIMLSTTILMFDFWPPSNF